MRLSFRRTWVSSWSRTTRHLSSDQAEELVGTATTACQHPQVTGTVSRSLMSSCTGRRIPTSATRSANIRCRLGSVTGCAAVPSRRRSSRPNNSRPSGMLAPTAQSPRTQRGHDVPRDELATGAAQFDQGRWGR